MFGGTLEVLEAVPADCQSWHLAYIEGGPVRVQVHGPGFSYRDIVRDFSQKYGNQTKYFTFTNEAGTYVFSYEVISGQYVIKICSDGVDFSSYGGTYLARSNRRARDGGRGVRRGVRRGGGGGRGRGVRGVGAIFSAPFGQGNDMLTVKPLGFAVNGTWANVWPSNAEPGGAQNMQRDLQMIFNGSFTNPDGLQANPAYLMQIAAGGPANLGPQEPGGKNINGYLYFGLSDPTDGAPQTPGEPPGVCILRYSGPGGSQPTMRVDMCTSAASRADTSQSAPTAGYSGSGGSQCGPIDPDYQGLDAKVPVYAPPDIAVPAGSTTVPSIVGLPPCPGLWWWRYSWVYMLINGLPTPGSGRVTPPNNSSGSGEWVQTGNASHYAWYPTGPNGYGSVVGGDGTTYATYASAAAAAAKQSFAAPAGPPPGASSGGQWVSSQPCYWVWIPSATTSTNWLWLLLLGLLVAAGGGYYYYES